MLELQRELSKLAKPSFELNRTENPKYARHKQSRSTVTDGRTVLDVTIAVLRFVGDSRTEEDAADTVRACPLLSAAMSREPCSNA